MRSPPRLILRTHPAQARIEGSPAITDRPDDYLVVVDGPIIGRIYRIEHGPMKGRWAWFLQVPIGRDGTAQTLDEAKAQLRTNWERETG